jgi:hypothetical protein
MEKSWAFPRVSRESATLDLNKGTSMRSKRTEREEISEKNINDGINDD